MASPRRSRPALAPRPHTIAVLQTHSLPGLVQRELERMILAGELTAGAKLNEVAIAERLGVSRGPVREAFRALEESGLVRLEKNRGVFVRQIAVEEADEIYELRAVLDEFVGRRVAQKASAAEIKTLRALVDRMDRSVSRNDVDGYHAANLEFHDALVSLAGNAQAPRHLPPARQRAAPLSSRHARPGRRASGVRRASTTTSSTRSPPGKPPPPGARCSIT